jgi:hypothetical protein
LTPPDATSRIYPIRPEEPTVYFYTASIAHPNGETTRRRITADSDADARKVAHRVADSLGREYSSVEIWR